MTYKLIHIFDALAIAEVKNGKLKVIVDAIPSDDCDDKEKQLKLNNETVKIIYDEIYNKKRTTSIPDQSLRAAIERRKTG